MTWLEEKLLREDKEYYRIILNDPEYNLEYNISNSKVAPYGFFQGVGEIISKIYDWCEDEDEADEIHDELDFLLNKLERDLPYPNVDRKLKAKFAYKRETFNSIFNLLDEMDDLLRSLNMGFSLEYEEVHPDKIVYEDDYQIAYISEEKR